MDRRLLDTHFVKLVVEMMKLLPSWLCAISIEEMSPRLMLPRSSPKRSEPAARLNLVVCVWGGKKVVERVRRGGAGHTHTHGDR